MDTDILIAGGSLGGVLAAKAALSHGMKVILTEETDWIGGQLTSQAVPPDEHPWIEEQGRTQSYAQFRKAVREHYKNLPDASDKMKNKPLRELNPGNGWVSRVAHEPKVALAILQGYLAPYQKNGQLELLYFTVPVSARTEGDEIRSVTVRNVKTGETRTVTAKYYLDATDCGDLLPLVGAEYRTGAESRAETGEPDAPEKADPYDMQPVTYVAALGLMPREKFSDEYKIKKPETYEYFKSVRIPFTDKSVLSWFSATQSDETHAREWAMFDDQLAPGSLGFWTYRRIVDKDNYTDINEDVSLINWPQNDYCLGNIFEEPGREKHRALAKELTRSLIYWLQNEAPNEIGTVGFPVRPRGDVLDTEDGHRKGAVYPRIAPHRREKTDRRAGSRDVGERQAAAPGRFGRGRALSYRPAFHDQDAYVAVRAGAPLRDTALGDGARAAEKPHPRLQKHRHDAPDERLLPRAPHRVEHRGNGGAPRRLLHRKGHPARAGARRREAFPETARRERRAAALGYFFLYVYLLAGGFSCRPLR